MFLSTSQIATRLSVTRSTVCRWIRPGARTPSGRVALPAIRAGRDWRVSETALLEWLQLLNPGVHAAIGEDDRERTRRAKAAAKRMGWG